MQHRLVLVAFVIGCGGGGVSIDDLPDELEDAQCDRAVACESIQDRATCENAVDFDDEDYRAIKAAIDDGTIEYDADKAGECVDAFGGGDCEFAGFQDEDPCEDIFTGTVATGGACVIDLQCANAGECVIDESCDSETMCCTGVCMGSTTESPVGGPCGDDLHVCVAGSFCAAGTGTGPGTCTAPVTTEGAACEEIDGCVNPLYCNLSFTSGQGTCKRPPGRGAACNRMDLLPCSDSRDFCDTATSTCLPRVAAGGACSAALPCVAYASCEAGTCVADIPAGGACGTTGPDCAGSLECISGTCALPPVGMTCMLP